LPKSVFNIVLLDYMLKQQYFQDFDMRDKYQMFCHILFLDHKSMIKIETAGHKFVVPAPIKEDRPGGFGLDDVRHLLDSADVDESFDLPSMVTESKERMIIFRITRAGMLFIVPLTFSFTNVNFFRIS
jgi:hypothetical protein